MSKELDNEMYDANLISLVDDEGNEYEFEILEELEYEDKHYYALMPLFELPDEDGDPESTYMIFEDILDENNEPQLAEIDDDALLDTLAELFEEKFDEALAEEDEDE